MIGPTAEEVLAPDPGRFVIYSLQREGAWVRVCPDEGLVLHEFMKVVRQAPEAPAAVDVLTVPGAGVSSAPNQNGRG